MCVIKNIIKNYANFHSYMIYNEQKKSFDMKVLSNVNSGIYFIVEIDCNEKVLIHKVGMADGKKGLTGRMNTYWHNNCLTISKEKDKTITMIDRVMTNELKGRVLAMYYMEVPTTIISLFGYDDIKQSPIRDLECKLSVDAKKEGHPLLLSKFH